MSEQCGKNCAAITSCICAENRSLQAQLASAESALLAVCEALGIQASSSAHLDAAAIKAQLASETRAVEAKEVASKAYYDLWRETEAQLASARKALEDIRDGYERGETDNIGPGAYRAAMSVLTDEQGKD